METVEAPITELPQNLQKWLEERFRSHARIHFGSGQELLSWCHERDLLAQNPDTGKRSLRQSTPVQIYQAIRQIVLELECPDVLREMNVMHRQLKEMRQENALLQTTVAVLSGQLRAAREGSTDDLDEALIE